VRDGQIVVSPIGPGNPTRVPGGLIHHWIGANFLPGATIDDIIAVVRDYVRHQVMYRPTVIASNAIDRGNGEDRLSLLCLNRALWSRVALTGDYQASHFRVDAKRWYSISETTRLQQIDNYGQPDERILPQDVGTGYIWRLQSIVRAQRDGGAYVEIEAIALSRDIPSTLRWMVDPIIRRVSRNAFTAFLRGTEAATLSEAEDPKNAAASLSLR
jgi:hypothetical protein